MKCNLTMTNKRLRYNARHKLARRGGGGGGGGGEGGSAGGLSVGNKKDNWLNEGENVECSTGLI